MARSKQAIHKAKSPRKKVHNTRSRAAAAARAATPKSHHKRTPGGSKHATFIAILPAKTPAKYKKGYYTRVSRMAQKAQMEDPGSLKAERLARWATRIRLGLVKPRPQKKRVYHKKKKSSSPTRAVHLTPSQERYIAAKIAEAGYQGHNEWDYGY